MLVTLTVHKVHRLSGSRQPGKWPAVRGNRWLQTLVALILGTCCRYAVSSVCIQRSLLKRWEGLAIQILAARLGVVTGKHLAQLIRQNYSRKLSFVIWLFSQLAIIGSDIQEIIGTAIALKIIFNFSLWIGVLITATDTFVFMFLQQYGIRKIEAFFMTLIAVMICSFWVEMFMSHPDVKQIFEGIVFPEIPEQAIVQAVGTIGAVIMPHNLYLHSALVMSRNLGTTPSNAKLREANFYFAIESGLALLTSFLINMAIVVAFAQVFYQPDRVVTDLPGLYDASSVLSNSLGYYAKYFWAAGLLAAGQSSMCESKKLQNGLLKLLSLVGTMTGTLSGQYVCRRISRKHDARN